MKCPSLSLAPLCALGLGLLLCACAAPRVDFGEAMRTYKPGDYEKVSRRWTRHASLFHGVESVLFLSGTLKSWDFRQALLARTGVSYALRPAELEALTTQHRETQGRYHEVFLSVSMENKRWNDLDSAKSLWKLALVNDAGDEVLPSKVERLRQLTPELKAFFEYHQQSFSVPYVVRFPKVVAGGQPLIRAGTKRVTVRLAGAPGKVELHWDAAL